MLSPRNLADESRLRRLAWLLAGIAGALNAGGFLAVHSYTSHVTGAVSRTADALALGHWLLASQSLVTVLAFFLGALAGGSTVTYAFRHRIRGHYAAGFALESLLLLYFGLAGTRLDSQSLLRVPDAILLLSFAMGMHNSLITQVSNSIVRTTHMTGNVTDLGIEFSRLFYLNRGEHKRLQPVMADRKKLRLYGFMVLSFLGGGVAGALAFNAWPYVPAVPLALLLLSFSIRPLWRDLRARQRLWARS